MTLQDLYDALDWSAVDKGHSDMADKNGVAEAPKQEFILSYRATLLSSAMYGDAFVQDGDKWVLSGVSDEEKPKKAAEARKLLGNIWLQAVKVLDREGLVAFYDEKSE